MQEFLSLFRATHIYNIYKYTMHWRIQRGVGRGRVLRRLHPPPFQISKIKERNKTKQKVEDNPLEKEEERKSCMFVQFLCVHAFIHVSTNIFLSKFFLLNPPLKNFWIRACYDRLFHSQNVLKIIVSFNPTCTYINNQLGKDYREIITFLFFHQKFVN